MNWLGLVELPQPAAPAALPRRKGGGRRGPAGPPANAFRLTPAGAAFLGRADWLTVEAPPGATRAQVGSDGVIRVPAATAPYQRFRVARVTKWLSLDGETYTYRLTPSALRRAQKQGVELGRIVDFLREIAAEPGLPPTLLGALERWARSGSEAAVQELTVLRVRSADLLEMLQRTPKLKEFLGRPLGPTAVEVRAEAANQVRALLAELGILAD